MRAEIKIGGYRLRKLDGGKTEIVYVIDIDLGGSFAFGFLHRYMAQSYVKGVVNMHRKVASDSVREGRSSTSAPPPPLPTLSRALASALKKGGIELTTNPMFRKGDTSIEDGLNIEMGRMIKKANSKGEGDDTKPRSEKPPGFVERAGAEAVGETSPNLEEERTTGSSPPPEFGNCPSIGNQAVHHLLSPGED